jgi:RND superfamily putative drug exporter
VLRPLARFVTRYPRWVLAFWLSQLALALPLAAQVGQVLNAQPDVPPNSVAAQVGNVLREGFAAQGGETVVVLAQVADGRTLDEPDIASAYADATADLDALPGVELLLDFRDPTPLPLRDDAGTFGIALLALATDDLASGIATVERIRMELDDRGPFAFSLAGGPATFDELERVSERDAQRAELFGLPLSLLVLVVAFGALVASALPLLVALTSITLSLAALYMLGAFLDFAVFTQSVVTMLGLATGIDYALLMVSRFREELRYKFDPRVAAERTALTAGRAVAFSGLTVMVALSALLVPPLGFIRSIGVGSIVVLAVSVMVSLTALPALLALLGHRVNRLKITRSEPGLRSRTFWRERAETVMRRPWLFTVGGTLALLLLSVPALRMQVADPGALGLSVRTEARRTVMALEQLGVEGVLDSADVVIDFGEDGFFTPPNVRAISRFAREIEGLDGVRAVSSPMANTGVPALFVYQYYATAENARSSELAELVEATVSNDDRYALVQVIPIGNRTPSESAGLRADIEAAADRLELSIMIGGSDVFEAEWSGVLYRSFPYAVALVYLATLILLGLAFRSLLIPIKSIVLNTLTVGAAYGVITLIFQDGVLAPLVGLSAGLGYIDTSAPLFIFAIVFGLSMDYEVFLVARMVEGHEQGLSDRTAVASALASTGGVITSAAAIMIVVFSIFIFSEVVLIKTLGVGLSVAVLLDATLVRMVLVPAVMTLAGRWNWWLPEPIARLARRVDLRAE